MTQKEQMRVQVLNSLLAGATTMEQAKAVLKQFLPRYNRRFQVPANPSAYRASNAGDASADR